MKLTQQVLIFSLLVSIVFNACPTTDLSTCTTKCCATGQTAGSETCNTDMATAGVYGNGYTAAADSTCVATSATVLFLNTTKVATTFAATSHCKIDATSKSIAPLVESSYSVRGNTDLTNNVCKFVTSKTTQCVDATGLWVDLSTQTSATAKASAQCVISTSGACQLLYSGSAFTHGWKAAGDFTCVAKVATDTAPVCVDPLTYLASAVLTTGTKVCALAADNTCQPLTYENGAVRYTLTSATQFTCVITTTTGLLCGTAVCAPTHCCVGTTCTLAQDTTKNCLTSSTSITCLAQTTAQYYYNAKDASCVDPTTLTTNKVHCIDGTNKVLKTLVAADNKCINTDKTCTATTTTLTTTAADDFNCKTVTTTTTTTTTTSGNIIYLVGTFLILVSTILI